MQWGMHPRPALDVAWAALRQHAAIPFRVTAAELHEALGTRSMGQAHRMRVPSGTYV